MRLAEFEIQNFRGIESEKFTIYDFTTFIGPNNSGKSTVLRAIQIFLNQDKPEEEEWHAKHSGDPIIMIGRFTEITEIERNIQGISSLVYNNEIKLKLTITKAPKTPELNYTAYIREEHINGWSDTWGAIAPEIKAIAESLGFDGKAWRTKANQERIRQYIRDNKKELITYGDPDWTDEGISINEALQQGLPSVEIVPAVKDAKDEGQLTQRKNIFAEILEDSILPEVEATPEYASIMEKADTLSKRMTTTEEDGSLTETRKISSEISSTASEVIDLKVLFRLDPPDIKKAIKGGARIRLSDGTETPVDFQGHGAQRTLIYALIRYIAGQRAKMEQRTRPKILLFEEPELYVHPQLLRILRQSLKDLSELDDWQVIVTTHSPVMVYVADIPQSLIIMRRNKGCIEAMQLERDPFENEEGDISERNILRATLDFHPSVCEAFFADQALLVEGDSERAILNFAKDVSPKLINVQVNDVENTTIVSCSGKWTILPIARLLKEFGIPCKVIHDMDRKGLTNEQLEQKHSFHPFKVNSRIVSTVGQENVYVVEDTLEDILFPAGHQSISKDKPFTAWKRMKEILDNNELDKMAMLSELFLFAFGKKIEV